MKLRTTIQLSTTVVLSVLLIITNTSIYFIYKNSVIQSEMNRLTNTLNNIVTELNTQPNLTMEEVIQAYLINDGLIQSVTKNSETPVQVTTAKKYRSIPTSYEQGQFERVVAYKDSMFVVVSVPTIDKDGAIVNLQVVENVDVLFDNINDLKWVFVYATLIVIAVLFLTSRLLGRVIVLPIQRLMKTMQLIEKEGSFEKIAVLQETKDELTEMAMTFNRMITRLEDSYRKQEQFVSDASHELKTPLTVIDSYVKLLQRWGKERPDILEEAIDAIASESSRMKYLTEQLLQLAKSEEMVESGEHKVNVVPVLKGTLQRMRQSSQQQIRLFAEQEMVEIYIHEQSFVQLLVILVDNAIKYSDSDIAVELIEHDKEVSINVIDNGIGIADEDQPYVFNRMYRVDKTRSRKTGGTGLGLSIAKQIVERHSGTIILTSAEGKGSTFTVRFPKVEVQTK